MFSNKDFASMMKSGGGGGEGSEGKTRFDLKQVAQWDRQIKTQLEKKEASVIKPVFSMKPKSIQGVSQYRDRAAERRKEEKLSSQTSSNTTAITTDFDVIQSSLHPNTNEEMVAARSLDAEQSKFLGGDLEHTHLVKGLDYALLAKIRSEAAKAEKTLKKLQKRSKSDRIFDSESDDDSDVNEEEEDETQEEDEFDPDKVVVKTIYGLNIRKAFFPRIDSIAAADKEKSQLSFGTKINIGSNNTINTHLVGTAALGTKKSDVNLNYEISQAAQLLNRTVFRYTLVPPGTDPDEELETDIPLNIVRSKKESSGYELYTAYNMPEPIYERLKEVYSEYYDLSKQALKVIKKKKFVTEERPASLAVAPPVTASTNIKGISIYDDDDLAAPIEETPANKAIEMSQETKYKANAAVVFSDDEDEKYAVKAKGIFQNIKTAFSSGLPVKEVVTPATLSSKTLPTFVPAKPVLPVSVPLKPQSSQVVNRDVFASTIDKVVTVEDIVNQKQGDVFGMQGSYDVDTNDYDGVIVGLSCITSLLVVSQLILSMISLV